ncbi:MAG: hypothetical protein AAFY29_09035 [Pseudomonadota bacterium]
MYVIKNTVAASARWIMAILILASVFVYADDDEMPPRVVTAVLVKAIPLYDDDLREVGSKPMKKRAFDKNFVDQPNGDPRGLSIIEERTIEGIELLKVELTELGAVWIERNNVQVYPSIKVDCPKVALGKSEEVSRGVAVGFGDYCDSEDKP